MADKDVALGIMQAAIALAGLLLVFVGFLLSAASQTSMKSPRLRLKAIAMFGLIPFSACLSCAWESLWVIQGAHDSALYLFISAKIVMGLTGFYAILATIFGIR